jgi:hypothetical protein
MIRARAFSLLILALIVFLPAIGAAQSDPIVENDVTGETPAPNPNHPAPYAKLAEDLGTPTLVSSAGLADKSLLRLRFVDAGESGSDWVKMTSISIAKRSPRRARSSRASKRVSKRRSTRK